MLCCQTAFSKSTRCFRGFLLTALIMTIADDKFIAALDVGTTFTRCFIFDKCATIVGSKRLKSQLLNSTEEGHVEIDPDSLWLQVIAVLNGAIEDAKLTAHQISGLSIAAQRNTFVTWDRETGKPFHNFIVWSDTRSLNLCSAWNNSYTFQVLNVFGKLFYWLTGSKRCLAAAVLQLRTAMVTPRLLSMISALPELRRRISEKQVCFGCIDTWLLWKFTGGRVHATDVSNASGTGLFDPYTMSWSKGILYLLNIPSHILPEVRPTCCEFGSTMVDPDIFGAELPICVLVADQQAAMFGCNCLSPGDVKLSFSTGVFIDVNTDRMAHSSVKGIVPLVGWKINHSDNLVYLAEGFGFKAGTLVQWAASMGLFSHPEDLSKEVFPVFQDNGLLCISNVSRLPVLNSDNEENRKEMALKLCFIGKTQNTSNTELVSAVLESVAFGAFHLFELCAQEAVIDESLLTSVRVTGGVSNNDFVCQLFADLCGKCVERLKLTESTAFGAALFAGISLGFWTQENISQFQHVLSIFTPSLDLRYKQMCSDKYNKWKAASKL